MNTDDKDGRFTRGMWVTDETTGSEGKPPEITVNVSEKSIEQRITEISENTSRDIDDILHLTRDLLTTQAGHSHIEQLIDNAGNMLEKAVSDLFRHSPDIVNDRPDSSGNSPDRSKRTIE